MQRDDDEVKVGDLSQNDDFQVRNREYEARQSNLTVGW